MAEVEVQIRIALEDSDEEGIGISDDAEVLYDEIFYSSGGSPSDALVGAEDALNDALVACHIRAGVLAP